MTDFGDIASAVAIHGEARKTEDPMSQFLASGLPTTVGALGKGPIERCADDALRSDILSSSLPKYSEVSLGPVPVASDRHQCLINQLSKNNTP